MWWSVYTKDDPIFVFEMATSEQITSIVNDSYFISLLHIRPFLTYSIKPPQFN